MQYLAKAGWLLLLLLMLALITFMPRGMDWLCDSQNNDDAFNEQHHA
jgi:hypothetical protein